jgi:hypothetical protein
MATVTKNKTYGKIAGFWVIMTNTARSNYPAILKKI